MPLDGLPYILVVALSLSADCFVVAVGTSSGQKTNLLSQMLRMSSVFGLFQALMSGLGWLIGRNIFSLIANFDHWVAFVLLAAVGGHMIWEYVHGRDDHTQRDVASGIILVILAFATSIDSLAVGLSFAFLDIDIVLASLIIGFTAFAITTLGFVSGRSLGKVVGNWAELAGGIILVGIGSRILISHLFS